MNGEREVRTMAYKSSETDCRTLVMAESKSLQEWRNSNSQKEAPCSDQIIKDIGQQLKAS